MTKKLLTQVVAVLMCVVFPAAMMSAETTAAMIYVSGNAMVNGSAVRGTATLFTGDRLQVPNNASVTVASHGSSVLVAPGSSVVFGGQKILLYPRSAVAITTTAGMAAAVNQMTVAPAQNGTAKFQVTRVGGSVMVSAKEGTVAVVNGSAVNLVAAGSSMTLADPAPAPVAAPTPAPTPAPQKPGSIPTPGAGPAGAAVPTWAAYGLAIAAAVAASAAVIASSGPPASPVAPPIP